MSDDNTSLIHIDGKHFGKAAQVLIEKVSAGVGGLYRPTQIRRVAKAEADAAVIAAEAEVRIGDLQYRAAHRWLAEESRKQENIESITEQAIPLLDEAADASKVEDDWIANFFEKSRIVSDEEMQSLWSQVLAGEANSPGKFSKRTVNLLADLDKSDAELFATVCRYKWSLAGQRLLIFDPENQIYTSNGVNFSSLTHLDSLGLLTFMNLSGYQVKGILPTFGADYYGNAVLIGIPAGKTLNVGKVMLTKAGEQLASIVKAEEVPGFYDYVTEQYRNSGLTVSPLVSNVTMRVPPAGP